MTNRHVNRRRRARRPGFRAAPAPAPHLPPALRRALAALADAAASLVLLGAWALLCAASVALLLRAALWLVWPPE